MVDFFGSAQKDLTNQTTTFGIKHIRNSNRTPVLNIQWFGNSKTIMFYLKHKARPCSGSTGSLKSFFYLLRSAPKSANKTSNCLTDILKTYKSGRDTASTWIKPWNSSCCCFLMRTECTQNLTFLQDQLIMSWCQLHFFLFTVCFLRPNFLQKYNTYSVHI